MSEDIEAKVRKIIAEKLPVDESELTPDKDFTRDLGADSLDTVELMMEFEDQFGLDSIPEEEAEKIQTVGQVVEYLKGRVEG